MRNNKEFDELFKINKSLWDKKTAIHVNSDFYDNARFMEGKNSLDPIVLSHLPEIKGKKILHLQCHFGQDSLSLARMGALVTGIDLSTTSIKQAKALNSKLGLDVEFIESNVYDIEKHIKGAYDIIFTSYGAICWLPDLDEWASLINKYLKPGGLFYMVEFHPYIYTLDFKTLEIGYPYFNVEQRAYIETETGTYTDFNSDIKAEEAFWLHALDEVFNSLMDQGFELKLFKEYPYSPYNCFEQTRQIEPGKYCIGDFDVPIPHVYAVQFRKK
jgi:SAM-dependent methyltransferase